MLTAAGYVPGRTQMETVGLYENPWLCMNRRIRSPNQSGIRSFVSRQHFRLKEKEEGFPKGGNLGSPLWLRAKHAIHKARRSLSREKNTGSQNQVSREKQPVKAAAAVVKEASARPGAGCRATRV